MPSQLHLGDESKLEMPNPFGNLNRAALRKVQAMAQGPQQMLDSH